MRTTPGVAVASPQLFLASLANASCCAVSEMFLIAYDPATDFTVRPWLERALGKPLSLGEAVGGNYVFLPVGDDYLKLYGYPLSLVGNLEATGTGLDQTLFFTFETAQEMARLSPVQAERPLVIPAGSVSAVLVKVQPGVDPHSVAASIARSIPEASALESPALFQTYRRQISGLAQAFLVALGGVWVLALGVLGLVFALETNRRRRELGVLRALGAGGGFVFASLLAEATLLAVAGAVPGIALASLAALLFRNLLVVSFGIPFLFPALPEYLLSVWLNPRPFHYRRRPRRPLAGAAGRPRRARGSDALGGADLTFPALLFKNITGTARLRSLLVVLCVALAAGFSSGGALVVLGAESGLRLGLQRLGADIVVVPETAEGNFESVLLMGAASTTTLPVATLAQVAGVEGVAAVAPQLYLGRLPVRGIPGATTANLVAFNPASDFTVQPWLAGGGPSALASGEAIAGSDLGSGDVPAAVEVAGVPLTVVAGLAPTGTELDRSLFISFATVETVREALRLGDPPVFAPVDAYSAVLVKARPESDFRLLAPRIVRAAPGALPVETLGMFRALQKQMAGLAQAAMVTLVLGWLLALAAVGFAFALASDERRYEIAVLRALGATRRFVLGSLLAEAGLLALVGGALGAMAAYGATGVLRGAISRGLSVPFDLPTLPESLLLLAATLVLASLTGVLAALLPALDASRADPALAARE